MEKSLKLKLQKLCKINARQVDPNTAVLVLFAMVFNRRHLPKILAITEAKCRAEHTELTVRLTNRRMVFFSCIYIASYNNYSIAIARYGTYSLVKSFNVSEKLCRKYS